VCANEGNAMNTEAQKAQEKLKLINDFIKLMKNETTSFDSRILVGSWNEKSYLLSISIGAEIAYIVLAISSEDDSYDIWDGSGFIKFLEDHPSDIFSRLSKYVTFIDNRTTK
jgi:hypothetical protein